MKFGEAFTEYLHGEQDRFLEKCGHVEYNTLKKVLNTCRSCNALRHSCTSDSSGCQCQSCPLCDQKFFSELMKEASQIAGCFSSRVRNDQQAMVLEGWMLIEYALMNAIAIKKILKKYDKIHGSVNGRNFKSKLRAEHVELLQSPWLIELGAFYLNSTGSDDGGLKEFSSNFSCDFNANPPVMTLMLSYLIKLEFDLTCAICLDILFNPYALSCGHLFCKSCACSSASVFLFDGLRAASPKSKCPICREVGVYAKAVHMLELDMLLKRRCKDYWKERLTAERAEMLAQSKLHWAKIAYGY
ncbi:probable E3 ubiquitin-protein ligase BAH1-like isoform X2 [Quercus suber]|uniref:probable E3 ubiquitin-protein ligase BAH1-like isoform X2 n=1 Tax=Quercus suber TaxID=58331 RepID=UPI0032DEC8A5